MSQKRNTPSVRRSPKSFPLKGRTFLTSVEALSLQGERATDARLGLGYLSFATLSI